MFIKPTQKIAAANMDRAYNAAGQLQNLAKTNYGAKMLLETNVARPGTNSAKASKAPKPPKAPKAPRAPKVSNPLGGIQRFAPKVRQADMDDATFWKTRSDLAQNHFAAGAQRALNEDSRQYMMRQQQKQKSASMW
jgi:hypothetical protein